MKRYYAVIQKGGPVYGVGESIESAEACACEWVDDPEKFKIDCKRGYYTVEDGQLTVVECSKKLHDEVEKNGGDIVYEYVETLIKTESEIEWETDVDEFYKNAEVENTIYRDGRGTTKLMAENPKMIRLRYYKNKGEKRKTIEIEV